jgi:hypothetical protein
MTPDERQGLIAEYKDGYAEVLRNLSDFPDSLLNAHPIPGSGALRRSFIIWPIAKLPVVCGCDAY